MKRFLKFLQSNEAVLYAAIMSLATQLWHSVKAFVMLDVGGPENKWNYLFGILFSVSTSFAILIFTVRARKNWAYFFLMVEIFVNIIHYNVMGMESGAILYATIFMSIIVPITIGIYSAEIDVTENITQESSVPPLTIGMKDDEFVKEINELIGFDITNPKDRSGDVSEDVKAELRGLWKKRKSMLNYELKHEMREILKKGSPLFKSL